MIHSLAWSLIGLVVWQSICVGQTEYHTRSALFEFVFVIDHNEKQFGNAFYEIDGPRFVYRVVNPEIFQQLEKGETTPSTITAYGFDGNEYWLAIFAKRTEKKWVVQEKAALLVRSESIESFDQLLPEYVRNHFGGHKPIIASVHKLAIVENVKQLLDLEGSTLSRKSILEAAETSNDSFVVTAANKKHVACHQSFFSDDFEYVAISGDSLKHHFWNYVLGIDSQSKNPIRRIHVEEIGKYSIGVGGGYLAPRHPLPASFQLRLKEVNDVDKLEYLPQFYSDEQTVIVTLTTNSFKE